MAGISIRVHPGSGPTVIYLPGLHGDWGLIGTFRRALGPRVRFVEFAYAQDEVTLEVLAASVHEALLREGVTSGWLLAQSFGSQVGWALIKNGFTADGVVLAGGFVKHPWPWGALFFRAVLSSPSWLIGPAYRGYTFVCNALARRGPEEARELMAFAENRGPAEWRATAWRLVLIARADPRLTAKAFKNPVHYLGGRLDPLVPWPWVTRWLARECPGYKGRTIFPAADHNVLGSAPHESAERVLAWLGA